jgi:periplasmic protein TonB
MRTWTLALSVCAHAVAIGVVIVAPIFATTDLPEPRRILIFESVTPIQLPDIPQPIRSQPAPTPVQTSAVPLTEPLDLAPEIPRTNAELVVDVGVPDGSGVPTGLFGPVGDVVAPPPSPPVRKEPLPIGGNIRPPARVRYVQPVYPRFALQGGVQGTVILQAVIDEQGSVREVKVLRSIPLLDDAAVQAVAQWKFTPTLLNGTPVPVVMTVTVGFALQK